MVGRSELGAVSEVEDGSTAIEPTISELVSSLKSAFQKAAFTRVEEALLRREEKLKAEIEKKEGENDLLRVKLQFEVLEKLELKELASRMKKERDGIMQKLGESKSDKREILELKRKNCELNCAKLNAETEVEICAGRLKVLEEKISSFEKDLEMMDKLDSINLEVEKNNASVDLLADTNAGTKEVSQELESRNENERFSSDAEVLPETNPNLNCSSSNPKSTDNAAVNQASDANAGNKQVGQEAESRLETGILGSIEKSFSGTKPNSSGSSSHGKRRDNRIPLANQIVEIIDSDDEAASSKADLGKNVAANDPAANKRALGRSLESCRVESGKRVRVEEHFVTPQRVTSPVDPKLSKILSQLGDDSSSSSSSDDDDGVDPSFDFSTFFRTGDFASKS